MRYVRYTSLARPPQNPFVRAALFVCGLVVFGFAIVIGGVLLAGLIGLGLLAALVIYARVWWLTRAARRGSTHESGREDVFEAEYRVIEEPDRDDAER
jgi:hypothetical protein